MTESQHAAMSRQPLSDDLRRWVNEQLAAGHTSISELSTGNSSSGQKLRSLRRQLFCSDSRWTTAAKRGPSRGLSA